MNSIPWHPTADQVPELQREWGRSPWLMQPEKAAVLEASQAWSDLRLS